MRIALKFIKTERTGIIAIMLKEHRFCYITTDTLLSSVLDMAQYFMSLLAVYEHVLTERGICQQRSF